MRKELPKTYEPQEAEGKIYQMWMDAHCFHAESNPEKKPFSLVADFSLLKETIHAALEGRQLQPVFR